MLEYEGNVWAVHRALGRSGYVSPGSAVISMFSSRNSAERYIEKRKETERDTDIDASYLIIQWLVKR